MAHLIRKLQEAVLDKDKQLVVIHRETDTDCVLMPDGVRTLSEFLGSIGSYGKRIIVLSGGATGSAEYNVSDLNTIELEVEIGDDSHSHTGSTVTVGTPNRVIVSGADNGLVISEVTATELGYLHGVTSSIQSQLNDKAAANHTHPVPTATDLGAVRVASGSSAPTDQSTGDLWFENLS